MKDLPPDPPIYTPSSECWWLDHVHKGNDPASVFRTLTAMEHIVYDCVNAEHPVKPRRWSAAETTLLEEQVRLIGAGDMMRVWKINCADLKKGDLPETEFRRLLAKKDLKREY